MAPFPNSKASMKRTNTAAKLEPRPPEQSEPQKLKLIPVPASVPMVDAEHLEIAFGAGWDDFDSDDIDALKETGVVWPP
jgi:hypothetical protein